MGQQYKRLDRPAADPLDAPPPSTGAAMIAPQHTTTLYRATLDEAKADARAEIDRQEAKGRTFARINVRASTHGYAAQIDWTPQ